MSRVRTERLGPQIAQVFQVDHDLPQTQQARQWDMGEGLRGCFPKTQAAEGEGADRAGLAIPFQTPS